MLRKGYTSQKLPGLRLTTESNRVSLSLSGCHNKLTETRWLKQQKLNSSQFWRLEGPDQGKVGSVFGEYSLSDLHTVSFSVLTWISLDFTREIRKYYEMNENEKKKIYQNL